MNKIGITILAIIGIIYYIGFRYLGHNIIHHQEGNSIINFKPSSTIQFKINNPYNETISICELRVPENYKKDIEIPIFVWFGPGHGNNNIKNVPEFVDFKNFFILALPYLDNQLPKKAIKEGYIDEFWEYSHPMLEYVLNRIPNVSQNIRIVAGYSSGAHFIGSGLDRNWEGFTDYFTGYILHEGGYAPEMTYEGLYPLDEVLVTYGLKYDSPVKIVAELMMQNHKNTTTYALPNTGHEITPETIKYIRRWVEEKFY